MVEFEYVNKGVPVLVFNNIENYEKYAIHIWKTSLEYKNDKTRVHISGWQSKKQYEYNLTKPGEYYCTIFLPNSKKINTNIIRITYEELFKFSDQSVVKSLSEGLISQNKLSHDAHILLQKMFIVGSDKILSEILTYMDGDSQLSIFSSEESVSISNALYSMSFFDGKLGTPKFYSDDTLNKGYLYSMTFRSYLGPVEYAKFKKNDVLIILDKNNSVSKDILIEKAKAAGAKILDIYKLVHEAYIDKYLITPLTELSNKVLFLNLPTATKIKNPSEGEVNASKHTIGVVRNNLQKNIYPEVLKQFNSEYIHDVLDGWNLEHHIGYDTLVESHKKYVNVVDGHRYIKNNGQNFINGNGRVLFFGNSVIYGIGSDDDHNLPSLFAKKSNIHTQNLANFSMNDFVRGINLIKQFEFTQNDVVVIGVHLPLSGKLKNKLDYYIDMQQYFDHPRIYDDDVFIDMTHLNMYGYEIMAQALIENEKGWRH